MEPSSIPASLDRQLVFLAELDKLKDVLRQGTVAATDRRENSAEHSWHFALLAVVLAEHAGEPTPDLFRVIKMALVHDIVEIDAGDTFYYDAAGQSTKADRERAAADRIFSLLPPEQGRELRAVWEEFEAEITPEAKWAQALDRLQAVLQNLHTGGAAWRRNRVTKAQVVERNRKIGETMPGVWASLVRRLDEAERQGFFDSAATG